MTTILVILVALGPVLLAGLGVAHKILDAKAQTARDAGDAAKAAKLGNYEHLVGVFADVLQEHEHGEAIATSVLTALRSPEAQDLLQAALKAALKKAQA